MQERIQWVDVCRGIGILLVILGHCAPPFNKYIYGFHMPLFFVLTGYLWNPPDSFQTLAKKYAKKYLIPYFVLCAMNLCLNSILRIMRGEELKIAHYVFGILYSRGTLEWMPNCSPLWFLTAIYVALILVWLVNSISRAGLRCAGIIICPLISYTFNYLNVIKLPWNIDTAFMGVLFIEFGILIRKRTNVTGITLPLAAVFSVFLPIGYLMININPVTEVSFDNNRYGNLLMMIAGALLTIMSVMIISHKLCTRLKCSYIAFLGKHTMFIMGFDYFSGTIAGRILGEIGYANWASIFALKLLLLTGGILSWIMIAKQIQIRSGGGEIIRLDYGTASVGTLITQSM